MNPRHLVPFLLLFAWQAAPTPEPVTHLSRLRLWFGGGATSTDYQYWGWEGSSCDCPTCGRRAIEQGKDQYSSVGVQADAWVAPTTRVSAALGVGGTTDVANRPAFGAALVAWEGSWAGVGGGWASLGDWEGGSGPAAYLRLGTLDGAHFRADLRAPTATPGVTGWARAGLAFNQGRRDGPTLFIGVGAVPVARDSVYDPAPLRAPLVTRPGLFGDATLGLGRGFDFFVRAHVAKGARGFAAGAVLRLAR